MVDGRLSCRIRGQAPAGRRAVKHEDKWDVVLVESFCKDRQKSYHWIKKLNNIAMVRLNQRNGRVWEKMCNEGCPQKTDIIELYLKSFYYCRMKLVDIANTLGVSSDAVEKGLKRFDKEAYAIERHLRKHQNSIKRKEKDKVRKQASREISSIGEKPYYLTARRLLNDKEILSVFRRAFELQGFSFSDNNEQNLCSRYIPSSGKLSHPVPMEAQAAVELIMPSGIKRTVEYEIRAMKADLVGVPGPAILDVPDYLKAVNIDGAIKLANLAIITAGYVPSDASLCDVRNGVVKVIKPSEINAVYELHISEGLKMTKVSDTPGIGELRGRDAQKKVNSWLQQARAAERTASDWRGKRRGQTGKKGKGGGVVNIEQRQKLSAINGN